MSEIWDNYLNRANIFGTTKRERALNREALHLKYELAHSLSYHSVTVDINAMGAEEDISTQNVVIIDSDNLNEKYIFSLPGETLTNGSLIEWADNYWIITRLDANSELRYRGVMVQCNFLLKWKDADGNLQTQQCIVDDGTKYMTGEQEDRDFIITRPDARISITITRNSRTALLNRTNRFIVDDPDSETKMAFALTKPLKVGNVYNGRGVYIFVLAEVASADNDNLSDQIADDTNVGYDPEVVAGTINVGGNWL